MSWIDEQDFSDWDEPQDDPELVEIEWTCRKASTEKAVLLSIHGEDFWIPRSLLHVTAQDAGRFSTRGSGEIPQWFADQEGIWY